MRHHPFPAVVLATVLAAVGLLAACGPGSEDLTDPREILTRTLTSTAGLRTVTIRAELRVRDANNPNAGVGGVDGGVLEAQVDLVATELSGRIVDAKGAEQGRLVYAGGAMFSTSGDGRWQQVPISPEMLANPSLLFFGLGGGGAPGGAAPDYVGALGRAIQGPALRMGLSGVEDCPTGRCYRTTVEIPREAIWPLMMSLTGVGQMPGFPIPEPDPAQLPEISLSVLSDTERLHLVELTGAGSLQAVSAQLRVQLAEHDTPVSIEPPPADLVDDPFGGMPGPGVPAPEPAP